MNCSQCSHPLQSHTKFCNNCGFRQETEPALSPPEKSCSQCGAACKPDARFCTQCGLTFSPTSTTADTASPAHTSSDKRSAESVTPPGIEPAEAAEAEVPPPPPQQQPEFREAPAAPPAHTRAPAFPAEPSASSNGWIKWALLAMVIAAVIAGVQMAGSMKNMAVSGKSPAGSSTSSQDAVSAEDKARAEALVGPQTDAASAAPAAPVQPESSASASQSENLTPASAPHAATAPDSTSGTAAATSPAPAKAARPAPPRVEPPARNTGPSLDDLLD